MVVGTKAEKLQFQERKPFATVAFGGRLKAERVKETLWKTRGRYFDSFAVILAGITLRTKSPESESEFSSLAPKR